MKILIVGGTGMIGGHCATFLQAQGHEITVAARHAPMAGTPMASMDVLLGDYAAGDFPASALQKFDAVVFAAGNDIRHIAEGEDPQQDSYWQRVNSEGIPAFARTARDAGVTRFVNVGSFYPQVAPQLIEQNAYVRSRHLADAGVRALANDAFHACSVNAPFVVGTVAGLASPLFEAYTAYAQGKMEGMPVFGPAGGANFISTLSLAEAVSGALTRGISGTAYLVGDENLTFAEFFTAFFRAVGSNEVVQSKDQEHPLLPDMAILAGRGSVIAYEPDAAETELLGYRRQDIGRAIEEIVAQFRT
jgi:nucleoside-diphosphate-sugar epimerase